MAQPFLATFRIYYPYHYEGRYHKGYQFCKAHLIGSAYKIIDKSNNDLDPDDCAQRGKIWFSGLLPSTGYIGTPELQEKLGNIWVTRQALTITGASGGSSIFPGSQVTATLRDSAFNKVKLVCLDTNQTPPQRLTTTTGGDTYMDAALAPFLQEAADPADPFLWMVSRSNHYLNATPFVSVKVTLNSALEELIV